MQYAHHEPSDTKSVSRDRICLKMQVNVSKLELSHFKSQGQRKINKVTLSPKNSNHVIESADSMTWFESDKTNKFFVQKGKSIHTMY